MTDQRPASLNLTPSPRILEMIAEVDLQLHQCLSELIDNALDELEYAVLEMPELEPRIDVELPSHIGVNKSSVISVGDNGRGMSPAQLRDALSAGTSGKQRFGSLGLFGMGYNIATARLGTLTEVKAGRKGDDQWVIATIDLTAMRRNSSYDVPLRYESKPAHESGTYISVTNLRDDIVARLSASRTIRDTSGLLGRIYTFMLRDSDGRHSGATLMGGRNQRLNVNNRSVRPHLPCIWDPKRSVTRSGAEIPAAIPIDYPLTNAFACMNCGRWYGAPHDSCVECESVEIEERERRIWGWLGIQRYADKSDFGLTFLRHGRVILYQDKSLFDWETPEGDNELEYPIELGMGRIVGEVHLDHAPVNVRKNNFDTSSSEWRFMVEKIRGIEPLRPRRLQGSVNSSQMGRLFNGYREVKGGLHFLMAGNGSQAIHDVAKQWATKFRKGDPDYETDERWYEAAKEHDRIKAGPVEDVKPTQAIGDEEWLDQEGLGHLTSTEESSIPISDSGNDEPEHLPVAPETDDERFARYRASSSLLPDTDRTVRIGDAQPILRIYVTSEVELVKDGVKQAYAIRVVAGEAEVYVDSASTLIANFGWTPLNLALVCAAPQLANVFSFEGSDAELVVAILDQFPDRKVDAAAVRSRAESLLDSLRERLSLLTPGDPGTFWDLLSGDSRRAAGAAAVSVAPDVDWDGAIHSGGFASYITPSGIVDLVSGRPDLTLDGQLFRTTYAPLTEDTQADQVARVGALLADLRRMVSGTQSPNPLELSRFLLTADLLDAEIVST